MISVALCAPSSVGKMPNHVGKGRAGLVCDGDSAAPGSSGSDSEFDSDAESVLLSRLKTTSLI